MTRRVRFIHVADIHLGASIRGLSGLSDDWMDALQEAIVNAWERVVAAAIAHEVDFVIIAGDMFDTSRPSYGDYLRLFKGLERLDEAGIPAYLVTGNHDPYTTWERDVSRLPQSATLLGVNGPEFTLFSRNGEPLCLIGGRSYYNQAWPEGEGMEAGISRNAAIAALEKRALRSAARASRTEDIPGQGAMSASPEGEERSGAAANAADAPFMIGVIHAGLNPDQSKACAELNNLLSADVDYWACGHLHERHVFPNDANPHIVYPGCVQGTKMDEGGERSCLLVELEQNRSASAHSTLVRLEPIPTSSVIFEQLTVNVEACQTLADVRRHVQAEQFHENGKAHCDQMITRITLVGQTPLHGFLSKREIIENLRQQINNSYPNFHCDALVDATRPPEGEAAMVQDSDFFPEIVRSIAQEQREREDVLINFVQSEFVKRGVSVPGSLSENVGDFNDRAERLVLDLLREESE